ncbi:MAG: hypothetical protein IT307_01205 [Chloroflexi bacterium]|nr:hypothetical protein [Chloroflexota bacterium]
MDKLSDLLLNDRVKEALGQLGDQLPSVPKVGPLLDQGIKKLRAAFDALVRLVGRVRID